MIKIKICGITNKQDAIEAADLRVDMLGFIFCKASKRYVEPGVARDIINELPPSIIKVGVFMDEKKDRVLQIAEDVSLDMLQFHGDETPEYCGSFRDKFKVMKAFRLKNKNDLKNINDYDTDYYLLDTYVKSVPGGTGKTFDWDMVKDFEILRPVILSGGLTPLNVVKAVEKVLPYGVDVSSGVEKSPGRKDAGLMKKFVENVRKI